MRPNCFRAILPMVIAATLFSGCDRSPSSESATTSSSDASTTETSASESAGSSIEVIDQIVEAACGECQFGMDGTSCDLAVRIDGVSYFVDGFTVDDFGDAHAADGLCNAIQQARVTGRIEGGRFIARAFEVLSKE